MQLLIQWAYCVQQHIKKNCTKQQDKLYKLIRVCYLTRIGTYIYITFRKTMIRFYLLLNLSIFILPVLSNAQPGQVELLVKKCADFPVTGAGDNPAWEKTPWTLLNKLDKGDDYETRFRILYSSTGIYVLFNGTDKKITTSYQNDFEDLFRADVYEVFFHPDTLVPIYFEYEINQLNKELVLLVPNLDGRANGWVPWHYENEKRTKKMVKVVGGTVAPGSDIQSWSAEIYFPFRLFNPLGNVPPKSGTTWNANFYRLDYDNGQMVKSAWAPIDKSFHEYKKFKPIRFE
jgi:hypothetical protein